MANRKVTLVWYCKVPEVGWRILPCSLHAECEGADTAIPKAGYVKVKGEEKHYPEGRFMLRSYDADRRTVYTAVDSNIPQIAHTRLQSAKKRAVNAPKGQDSLVILKKAVAAYIKDCKQRKATEAAVQARLVLEEQFLPLCKGVTHVRFVTREHIFAFHKSLRDKGMAERTIHNKHMRLRAFFRFCKVDVSFMPPIPKYESKLPTIYSPSEIKALRQASDPYMRLVVDMALKLGLREQELVYSSWNDLDVNHSVFRVQGKPSLGFALKDSEQREVPIPQDLLTALSERHTAHPDSTLILGTAKDTPNTHLLRTLKRLAKRVGLNCGKCDGCKAKLEECQEWTLHKFRRTYLTTLLRNGLDLKTVQHYAGHSDLASTMRYLRHASTKESQSKINSIVWQD